MRSSSYLGTNSTSDCYDTEVLGCLKVLKVQSKLWNVEICQFGAENGGRKRYFWWEWG